MPAALQPHAHLFQSVARQMPPQRLRRFSSSSSPLLFLQTTPPSLHHAFRKKAQCPPSASPVACSKEHRRAVPRQSRFSQPLIISPRQPRLIEVNTGEGREYQKTPRVSQNVSVSGVDTRHTEGIEIRLLKVVVTGQVCPPPPGRLPASKAARSAVIKEFQPEC